ncbi:Dihydrofolate reductase [Trueperella bernardiae]|uniref:Dihydrofolate reductase n=2 Tax=Trueperella bernardiae TaxID=59561 RepID=A0A0W1KKE6_9ACTO|nr:Dihydrofolate reductase [Trueperella bernardiae]
MLGMIWAQGHERAIGRGGAMAWHLPEDMRFFRRMTTGHPVIMGRRTWESLDERYRPLPGRTNIVLTRDESFSSDDALVARSLDKAIALGEEAAGEGLVWIVGGAQLYEAAMKKADGVVVTDIDIDVPDADAFAPAIPFNWEPVGTEPFRGWHVAENGMRFRVSAYRRRRSGFVPGDLAAALSELPL